MQAQIYLKNFNKEIIKPPLLGVAASESIFLNSCVLLIQFKTESSEKNFTNVGYGRIVLPALEENNFNHKGILDKIVKQGFLSIGKHSLQDNTLDKTAAGSLDDFIKTAKKEVVDFIKAKDINLAADELTKIETEIAESGKLIIKKLHYFIKTICQDEVLLDLAMTRNQSLDCFDKIKAFKQDELKQLLVLDIEATDVASNLDAKIIQIGICNFFGKKIYNQLINPEESIPKNDKHKISDEMVADVPTLTDSWEEIIKILNSASYVFAYNAPADFAYLENNAKLYSLPFKLSYDSWFDLADPVTDLIGKKRWIANKEQWMLLTPKLFDAFKVLAADGIIDDSCAHDALADAITTALVAQKLLQRYKEANHKNKSDKKTAAKTRDYKRPMQPNQGAIANKRKSSLSNSLGDFFKQQN